MTDKQIAEACLKRWEQCYATVQIFGTDIVRAHQFLRDLNANDGICKFIRNSLSVPNPEWIVDGYNGEWKLYWYRTPKNSHTVKDILESLLYRVNTLKRILNDMQ